MSSLFRQAIQLVGRQDICKLYHNANYDIQVLRELAAVDKQCPDPDVWNYHDTAIMAQVSGKRAALEFVGAEVGIEDLFSVQDVLDEARVRLGKQKVNMLDADQDLVALKCMNDVRATWAIYDYLTEGNEKLQYRQLDVYEVDRYCLSILKTVERKGFAVDHDALNKHYDRLSREVVQLNDICQQHGFSASHPQQVGYILALRGNILPFTKTRRQLKTDDETLSKLDDPLAHLVLAYRKSSKLLSTYVRPWLTADRAYTHFRLDLSTGRLASYDRNQQNIPPLMRDIFDADSGSFTWADISQLEMRVFAEWSQDPLMLRAYRSGKSIHKITQEGLWPGELTEDTYGRSKTFNFAMIYDAQVKTLAERTGLPETAASVYRSSWLNLYNVAAAAMDEAMAADVDVVEDFYGRRMLLPEVTLNEYGRSNQGHVNKCKVNYPIQGTGASIVKRGINYLWGHGYGDAYRLQVHDEHVLDGDVEWPVELDYLCDRVATPHEVKRGSKWY